MVADGRALQDEDLRSLRVAVPGICREHGTDGFMMLLGSACADFKMEYYNSDGSGGMMCGNGGRCIVAFAAFRGLRPAAGIVADAYNSLRNAADQMTGAAEATDAYNSLRNAADQMTGDAEATDAYNSLRNAADQMTGEAPDGKAEAPVWRFEAPDGIHTAQILEGDGTHCTVRLRMTDVRDVRRLPDGLFLNTGTRHFVTFVPDVEAVDVAEEGRKLRWSAEFAPEGANVNFVSIGGGGRTSGGSTKGAEEASGGCGTKGAKRAGAGLLNVRTFEKGVEAETLACGTGITASAIAAYLSGIPAAAAEDEAIATDASEAADCKATGEPASEAADCKATGEPASGAADCKATGEPASGAARQTVRYVIQAREARLEVDFTPQKSLSAMPEVESHTSEAHTGEAHTSEAVATDIYLTGPAELLGINTYPLEAI